MKVIFGLGNPGAAYRKTRHNVGFDVLDMLAKQHDISFTPKRPWKAHATTLGIGDQEVLLIKPQTYMNKSGISAKAVLSDHPEALEAGDSVLVILDDIALPLGTLRLRAKGSAGSHNGLTSVIEALPGYDVARLRIGVGKPANASIPMTDYVLARFQKNEKDLVEDSLLRSVDACIRWIKAGTAGAMQAVNTPKGAEK